MKVIIAGAGVAAHLAGVLAAHTALPVIGVPMQSDALQGLDALLSNVQMPPGVPVATVGVNGAKNAGILAAQIIGAGDVDVRLRVENFKARLAEDVEKRNARLQALGVGEPPPTRTREFSQQEINLGGEGTGDRTVYPAGNGPDLVR